MIILTITALSEKLKKIPEFQLFLIVLLLFPLSLGTASKLFRSGEISVKSGNTEINLGEIKQAVRQSDQLVNELQIQNQQLIDANKRLQTALTKSNLVVPELNDVQEAIAKSEQVTTNLKQSHQNLQQLATDAVENVIDEDLQSKSFLGRWFNG